MSIGYKMLFLVFWACWSIQCVSEIRVQDDTGAWLTLSKPVTRVVSLAPHLSENLYAVGAGNTLVGVSRFSDFPEAVQQLPQVSDFQAINVEQILQLRPELILAWVDGGNTASINKLIQMGIPVYWSRPARLQAIPGELRNLGLLTGTQEYANVVASQFELQLEKLTQKVLPGERVKVFYQVWQHPLQTLNRQALISDIIDTCGGRNVFADLKPVVAEVSVESVMAVDPEVILGSHPTGQTPQWQSYWQPWQAITAVAIQSLFSIEADIIARHTPRVLQGLQQVCESIASAR